MKKPTNRKLADIEPELNDPISFAVNQRDRSTMEMVRSAIEHKQTMLAFQPVVRGDSPDRIAFHEGLIRVLDPTGRVIPAGDFMDAVEDSELGRELDTLALRMGLTALRNNPGLRLSINMSARSIGYRPWMQTLNRALNRDGMVGERLILEITESSAMNLPELVNDFMRRLQTNGICFALDDFGSGHTAIRYFKDMYFDIVKIDGQFIRGIAKNPDNQAVARALISVAENFEMLTVAECVETAAEAAVLAQLGISCLQGYHFGAPTTRPPWINQGMCRTG